MAKICPDLAKGWRDASDGRKTPAFTVIGPDRILIREKPFTSRKAAERGIKEFVARFREQSYYVGVGYRLELDEIAARCTVKEYGTGASPVPPVP